MTAALDRTADAQTPEPMTFADALRQLALSQKTSIGAPAYSRYVNRPAGRILAAVAYRLGCTPDQVTAMSALFTFSALAVLALMRPTWWSGILLTGLLVIGYALDAADGQLARLRGGGSPAGEWLDHMVDATKISALHLCVLISAFRFFRFSSPAWLLVPMGFAVVAAVLFFGMTLTDQLRRMSAASTGVKVPRAAYSRWRSVLVAPADYGLLCFAFLLLGVPHLFFAVYCVLFVSSAGFLALAAVRWHREMRRLPVASSGVAP